MSLVLTPITLRQAVAFIKKHHRHHIPSRGWKFGIGVTKDGELCGVAMAGRPVSRVLDDGFTLEVTRLCTDDTPHVASMLYGACWRAGKAMGYTMAVTYIFENEPGTSLKAAGWVRSDVSRRASSWSCPSRPRDDKHDSTIAKVRYEIRSNR